MFAKIRPQRDLRRFIHAATGRKLVFGIETSCDDTAMAVIDETGHILGEAHNSQVETHVAYGGILPPTAQNLHIEHIERIHEETMKNAGIKPEEIDAVAVTNRPGLALSLAVGVKHAKKFCQSQSLPLIPIHHMEAHALVVRSCMPVKFPFMVLLASGGHCQLALVENIRTFKLLGQHVDCAPGETLDKIARCLRLREVPEFKKISGGAAVEIMARKGNPKAFEVTVPMNRRTDCDFSFSGFRSQIDLKVKLLEAEFGLGEDGLLRNVADLCATSQHSVFLQISKRVQRAFHYCERKRLDFGRKLVVSGGVACSTYLRAMLQQYCEQNDVRLLAPPAQICSDNGIMIAWNGMERLLDGETPLPPDSDLEFYPKYPLGESLRDDVAAEKIRTVRFKLCMERLLKDTGHVSFAHSTEKT